MTTTTQSVKEAASKLLLLQPHADFVETPAVRDISQRALGYLHAGFPIHFRGPAGTGKTTLALHVAAQLARPVMLISGDEEFTIRFCQYLIERGYFTLGEIPNIFNNGSPDDPQPLLRRIQRLVADKMGVPETEPVPAALTFLADKTMLENSFSNYLAGTEAYRARLKEWENDKNPKPDAVPPNPTDMVGDAFRMLIDLDQFGDTPDHLAVRLALPRPPLQSNGRWDEALKQVAWDTDIEGRTNATRLPVFCYAIWGQANEEFQKAHFGKVALAGDNLTQYCLWRTDQDVRHGSEWDKFLEDLKPGPELMKRLDAFRFPGEPVQAVTNQPQNISIPSAYPRELLKNALP